MKKFIAILLSALLLTSCGAEAISEEQTTDAVSGATETTTESTTEVTEATSEPTEATTETPEASEVKILVAYFSCTNTTEQIAEWIADYTGADLYEIVAADPYTDEDLAYYTGGRADQEQSDDSARPEISGTVENIEDYDVIFLGYPIWHGQAPKIVYTFLESYDFGDVTIIPSAPPTQAASAQAPKTCTRSSPIPSHGTTAEDSLGMPQKAMLSNGLRAWIYRKTRQAKCPKWAYSTLKLRQFS